MKEKKEKTWQLELIGGFAEDLPIKYRAPYSELWRYFQSIPPDDEILKLLNAMMFLTFIMKDVPERVILERKSLEQLLANAVQAIKSMFEASKSYHQQLDRRLTQLPESIAKTISPEAIAGAINESLRQQFLSSTIPQTAEALERISADMKKVAAEFAKTAGSLGNAYSGVATDARRAVDEIQSSIRNAADTARNATVRLSTTFHHEYRWSLYALSIFGLVVGLALGMLIESRCNLPHSQPVRELPQVSRPASEFEIPEPMPIPKKRW